MIILAVDERRDCGVCEDVGYEDRISLGVKSKEKRGAQTEVFGFVDPLSAKTALSLLTSSFALTALAHVGFSPLA